MATASVCVQCGQAFANRQQLGAHVRYCRAAGPNPGALISADDLQVIATPVEAAQQQRITLVSLCRREKSPWGICKPAVTCVSRDTSVGDSVFSRDYRPVQQLWANHVKKAFECCYPHFWSVHESVRTQTAACRDTVLSVVKELIGERARGHRWPRSSRSLRARILKNAGPFWDAVTTTHRINMTPFGLPGVPATLKFSLIDPVYTWISRCNALHDAGISLQWNAATLHHPDTGEEVFGGGFQYSAFLRKAQYDIGRSGRVAAFNINWDGGQTGFGARSCTPIHVQVMNTNSSSPLTIGTVGYMPHINVAEGMRGEDAYKRAREHVLQSCIGFLLDAIEARAKYGFKCTIGGETMVLFPRLGCISLDTPEKKKYFGLRNQSTCPLCRKRKGRSVARDATFHDPIAVERSLQIACTPDAQATGQERKRRRKEARDQLLRHGFKWENRCRLHDHAKRILVHIPWIGQRMFAGTARYERMHVYFIGYCGYTMDLLVKCVCKTKFKEVTESVLQCHQFRDPITGVTHPRLPHLLKMTHLTAERRVRAIFYWAHVLGLSAEVVKEPTLRGLAQRAVATLQIILISLRGHRAYTAAELDVIFKEVGTEFFRALEQIAAFYETDRYNKKRQKHTTNPTRYAAAVLFQRTKRSFSCLRRQIALLTLNVAQFSLYVSVS